MYESKLCEFKDISSSGMTQHLKNKHHQDGDWTCKECDFQTNSNEYFKSHINEKHEKALDPCCDICEKVFRDKDSLREHMKSHTGTFKPCKYFLKDECKFGNQCRYSHRQLKKGEVICYICGQT